MAAMGRAGHMFCRLVSRIHMDMDVFHYMGVRTVEDLEKTVRSVPGNVRAVEAPRTSPFFVRVSATLRNGHLLEVRFREEPQCFGVPIHGKVLGTTFEIIDVVGVLISAALGKRACIEVIRFGDPVLEIFGGREALSALTTAYKILASIKQLVYSPS